jgi:WD40 repeat protein
VATIPVPTPTPTATATPKAETFPLPGRDEIFVYSVGMGADNTVDRFYPRRAVIVQELASGRILAKVPYSGKIDGAFESPMGAALAGRQLVVATESHVLRYELDGSGRTVLFEAPAPQSIADIAVSPDGHAVAVSSNCYLRCPGENAITVIDVNTGSRVIQVKQSAATLGEFRGDFWDLSWRADSLSLWVHGATYSEGGGSRALVTLTGQATPFVTPEWGFGAFSPDGRYFADGSPQIGCMRVGGTTLAIRDTNSGAIVASVAGEGAYAAWEWSPDSKEFVFQVIAGEVLTDCGWADDPGEFRVYSVETGQITPVPNLPALHASWYGPHFVETVCPDGPGIEPVLSRLGGVAAGCRAPGPGDAEGDVFVAGAKIASWPQPSEIPGVQRPNPLGFLPK